jgi:hypothetical protein
MPTPFASASTARAKLALAATMFNAALLGSPSLIAGEVKRTEPMLPHQGYSREHCVNAPNGSTLDFRFEGAQPVDFNIHHHPDKGDTVFAVRKNAVASLAKAVPIKEGGEYCFQWTNPADRAAKFPITVTYQIK